MITCVGLLASASSLAAWNYGNTPAYNQNSNYVQHRDYEPADGYYSEPHYQGGRVTEENDDYRSMGPYYNNGNHYTPSQNYNQNPKTTTQGQMQEPGKKYLSLNVETANVGDRVRSALQKAPGLSNSAKAILVTADANGHVTISGSVATQAEKSKIESIVQQVQGVQQITDKITIQNHK